MISRTHLRQFLAVVDAGSFTRAATQINVTQPTLSAGISELEKRLGIRLFARSNRRVQLTEAGNRLLTHARAIEREFRAAEQSVTGVAAPLQPVRLGVLLSIATTALEAALSCYRGADPIEITEGDERSLIAALGDGRIDLALTLVRAGDIRFEALPLFAEDYRLALPARHPLATRASVSPEEVAGEAMIARRSCEMLAETSRYFTERGVRPPFSLRSANDDRAMAMVRAGVGITVAPASLGGEGIAMPRLAGFDAVRQIGLLFGSLRPLGDHPLTETLGTLGQNIRTVDDVAVAKATS
ncbi:LysR family transcriptional regulator [Sphingomonas colocasiae]|uniref:LysR family transcriptional regulator n=1 Tax=Sphingomonas colocasiae TaxID=1848973 RepID=A0ABS7PP72_9SPHN|nr:LysR family transcriptional regulator [Sphingomonas colocasiae]MBY8823119.1 LysR family transcriptional regulator [Sphingomonas colocasiae]